MNDDLRRDTEQFFREQFPMVRAMAVQVESCEPERFVVTAPLSANHNHLGTAFGGSLSALCMLAGYGLLWMQLGDRSAHIVIADTTIHYRHPVRGDLRALCHRPPAEVVAAFQTKFAEKGRARMHLHVTVEEHGRACVEFEGTFVATR